MVLAMSSLMTIDTVLADFVSSKEPGPTFLGG